MRIITGSARGTRIETLEGEQTRPTAEKVKEALFSMIQFDIEGRRVLDLFGGSGQLGLEALSRGAASATFVDSNRDATEIIKKNAQKTKLFEKSRVLTTDWESFLKGASGREKYDIVFVDPPYAAGIAHKAIDKLCEGSLLADNALVVCETADRDPVEHEQLSICKHSKYGKTYITLYLNSVSDNDIEMA